MAEASAQTLTAACCLLLQVLLTQRCHPAAATMPLANRMSARARRAAVEPPTKLTAEVAAQHGRLAAADRMFCLPDSGM